MLNKFNNNIDDPLHTNAFAAAARNSGGVGATGPQSFSRRLHVERNRRNVNRYHDSMIANGHHRERSDGLNSASVRPPSGRPTSDVTMPVRPRFTEPPTRGYNPYK